MPKITKRSTHYMAISLLSCIKVKHKIKKKKTTSTLQLYLLFIDIEPQIIFRCVKTTNKKLFNLFKQSTSVGRIVIKLPKSSRFV